MCCHHQAVGAELTSVSWGECGHPRGDDKGDTLLMTSSLPSLQSLDISDNNISKAGLDLRPLTHLDQLSLGPRSQVSLTPELLETVSETLTSLILTGALELRTVKTGTFKHLRNLRNISITDNPLLSIIEPKIIEAGGPYLSLDLSRNSLKVLAPASVPWAQVRRLDLSGNPLLCDCRLAWLAQSLRHVPDHDAACYSPSHVSGTQLSDLTELSTCHSLETWHVAVIITCASSLFLLLLGILILFRCRNRPKTAGVRDIAPPSYLLRPYGTGDSGDTSVYWDYRANLMDTEMDNKMCPNMDTDCDNNTGMIDKKMAGPYSSSGLYGTLYRPGTVTRADSLRFGTMKAATKPYYDPEYMPGPAHQHQLPGVYATLLPHTHTASKTLAKQKPATTNKFWKVLSSTAGGRKSGSSVPESVYTLDPRVTGAGVTGPGNIYTGNPGSMFPDPGSSVQMLTYSQPDIVYFDLLRGVGAPN